MTHETSPSPEKPAAETAADAPATEAGTADALKAERDDLYDRLLRKTAEFDNYRKRVDRERQEQRQTAAADLIGDLLPLVDDFERALTVDAGPEAAAYRQGVELIYKQLADLLQKRGVTPIDTTGAVFDPHLHQAVAYEPSPDHQEGEIVQELRRGYLLGTRLLRPAMVKVAKA
ncbi:MAG: nucleotide exchange factor GrpE [Acidobacteriota bacterium]|nr:nucleotide exchange factor GrpE [Acidobacteriota bacterium]